MFSKHAIHNMPKINVYRTISITKHVSQNESIKKESEYRENEINIQMLSSSLHQQIFRANKNNQQNVHITPKVLERWKKDLIRHGITINSSQKIPEVDLKLPTFQGNDILEHFHSIAKEQSEPYETLIKSVLFDLPQKPKKWAKTPGWTCYDPLKGPVPVPFPDEQALIFDVEICMAQGKAPTLATAVGNKCWYSWTSSSLHHEGNVTISKRLSYDIDELIPLESNKNDKGFDLNCSFRKPKIIIGHNVSFDRARIKEQYWIEGTGTRFLDTMSLHVCVSGMTSYQRAMIKSHQDLSVDDLDWSSQTSLNSLAEVYKLYCGNDLSKERRSVFIDGTIEDIRKDFNNLVDYCADDVIATQKVLSKLFPLFQERFSHPVTLAGMLEIGNAYLPINSNWYRYIDEANLSFEELNIESKRYLRKRADQLCRLLHNDDFKKDLWLWDQDWSIEEFKMNKTKTKTLKLETDESQTEKEKDEISILKTKFKHFEVQKSFIPKRRPLLPGYPAWYRSLCLNPNIENWSPGAQNIGTGMRITPKLLSLCWEGYPLHYIKDKGWGFLVPYKRNENDVETGDIPYNQLIEKCPVKNEFSIKNDEELMNNLKSNVENSFRKRREYFNIKVRKVIAHHERGGYDGTGIWCNLSLENCCFFFKLPHKDGISKNVGNPLARDFLSKFSQNALSGDEIAKRIIQIARMVSYWRNNKDRIMGQMVVWLPQNNSPNYREKNNKQYGAILPQIVVCGTLTRRAMEPTWLTASNAQLDRVGSELRSMVQSPPGYKLVGADVDSQELWIASVLGDAHATGVHGATPLGWMTLNGTKSSGTDMHSVTAKAIGISRDHAKVINYARIYGAGIKFAERLLKQFNPTLSDVEAKSKAQKMFSLTKGKRVFYLRSEYQNDDHNIGFSNYNASEIAKKYGKPVSEVFHRGKWEGGTESAMFNRLEEIASSVNTVTPFLQGRLSRAVESNGESDDRFLPTRINWVVQSGAVDFLHLMLVCMRWLMSDNIRFCLSFHDEVRYLVKDEYAYKAALAMHVSNLLTRSFCAKRIGFTDLPQSIAFFTSVEVDTVLRKEAQMDCKTPSNPHGLSVGYGIQPGESLDIHSAIQKANGNNLNDWNWHKKTLK